MSEDFLVLDENVKPDSETLESMKEFIDNDSNLRKFKEFRNKAFTPAIVSSWA